MKYSRDNGLDADGSDISPKVVEVGRERLGVPLRAGTLDELSLPEGSVDAVVSLDTFYYVADPCAELAAMRRLVRPGGWLVLRFRNGLWSRTLARVGWFRTLDRSVIPAEHLWSFTPHSISRLLELSGWRVETCEPAAYSHTPSAPIQSAATALNRVARQAWHLAPTLTLSFNVVARRDE